MNILNKNFVIGAIIGDIAGSRFEFNPIKNKDFELLPIGKNYLDPKQPFKEYCSTCHFTDDTVMTIAVANAFLKTNDDFNNVSKLVIKNLKYFGNKYPLAGYGAKFNTWLQMPTTEPYNSYGNGSAMRISAVPYFAKNLDEVKLLSKLVTEVAHNHPEGVKGAEATAVCIWLAKKNYNKDYIKKYVEDHYYKLDFNYEDLVKSYDHDESCQNSVPQSIFAFLISNSYEDTIKTAISMGGDADTMACIAGGIAAAYYGLPKDIEEKGLEFLPDEFKEILEKIKRSN